MTATRRCRACYRELEWRANRLCVETPYCPTHGARTTWGVYDEQGRELFIGTVEDDHEHMERRRRINRSSYRRGVRRASVA